MDKTVYKPQIVAPAFQLPTGLLVVLLHVKLCCCFKTLNSFSEYTMRNHCWLRSSKYWFTPTSLHWEAGFSWGINTIKLFSFPLSYSKHLFLYKYFDEAQDGHWTIRRFLIDRTWNMKISHKSSCVFESTNAAETLKFQWCTSATWELFRQKQYWVHSDTAVLY